MSHSRARFALLTAFALAPFAFGCDQFKKDGADATAPPVVAVPAAPTAAADPAAAAAAAAATTPVAPLAGQVVTPPGAKPATAVDGGKHADASAPTVDGGKVAPAPTPTFTIPTAIPGFDAGAFKPPAGFPSTLPTFPPPAKP